MVRLDKAVSLKNFRGSEVLLKGTPNLYLYVENMKGKNGKIYRYLVLEEYRGGGRRRKVLRINVNEAIKLLISWKFGQSVNPKGYGAEGGIRTHAGLRHRGLSPTPLTLLGHPRFRILKDIGNKNLKLVNRLGVFCD